MPDVKWNEEYWNKVYGWPDHGEEWSKQWGSSKNQWLATILPRIYSFLPCSTIIEIAPGQGRWTRFLLDLCDDYSGFDISDNTVEFCRLYLAGKGKARKQNFFVNSGSDFPGILDNSTDFVFSFDSLVHCESDVIEGYISEIERVLRPGGYAFLHHSNLKMYGISGKDNQHCRGESVSAEFVRDICLNRQLDTQIQELVSWQSEICQDCFSLIRKPIKGEVHLDAKIVFNPQFWKDAMHISNTIGPYNK